MDEIDLRYQTTPWGQPSKLMFHEASQIDGISTLEVQLLDRLGVPCLDTSNLVRFGLTGDGTLLDNLGTSKGSRSVQLYNGRARISVQLTGPMAIASVASAGLDTTFLTVKKHTPVKTSTPAAQPTLNPTTK